MVVVVVGLTLSLLGASLLVEVESLVEVRRGISCRRRRRSREECDTAYGVAASVAWVRGVRGKGTTPTLEG